MTGEGGDRGPAVRPTADDPFVAALSPGIGGPAGEHVGRHPWWTPVRVILVLTAICFSLGMVQKAPCYDAQWTNSQSRYSEMCYSDLPYLYVGRGFAELDWPYSNSIQVRDRYDVMEYPVGISYYAYATAYVTHWLKGSPDLAARGAMSQGQLYADHEVVRESMLFTAVSSVGFGICALLAAWALTGVNRRRPWDAALFALSPVLLFEGLINWDLLAVACVAGALWAQARDRPGLTGLLIGLGTAFKLYPLFLLGGLLVIWGRERRWRDLAVATGTGAVTWALVNAPAYLSGHHEWSVFWTYNKHRGADLGSGWLVLQQMAGTTFSSPTINLASWIIFGVWCVGVAALGVWAPQTPRLAQLGFLVVVGFLLVNKVYSPQYALWLLPLAVMARPRWRDQLIWQAGEIYYFASVWWYLGTYLNPGGGGDPGFYWLAVGIRMAAQLYLAVIVVRDILMPEYDVVRTRRPAWARHSFWPPTEPGRLTLGRAPGGG
ncbi:glycosyltransferase family 87 protein [Nocardioides sp.]|uniref:glycosyltransferase family 87 protein n=1 Tax=Nocardioides sp. TaxID=35761 RepID=UPI002F3EE5D7